MVTLHEGQCGLCAHFGEHHATGQLTQVRVQKSAAPEMIDECGHPKHAVLHLRVTAISGCDGFEPAAPGK